VPLLSAFPTGFGFLEGVIELYLIGGLICAFGVAYRCPYITIEGEVGAVLEAILSVSLSACTTFAALIYCWMLAQLD
jgi:hypothetical protein